MKRNCGRRYSKLQAHCALLVVLMCLSAVSAAAPPVRPNVIVIIADQLRYQSVGYAGDKKAITPNIDLLAAQGVSFRNFVASTPVCAASRASLLTGKYASSAGMIVNELRLNPNQDSLAHVLSKAGYKNALVGKWHLWANDSNHATIANQFVPPGPYRLGFDDYWAGYNFWHFNYDAFYFNDAAAPRRIDGYGPEVFTTLALDYIRTQAKVGQPFNLVLALSPPHDPWVRKNVPEKWYRKFSKVEFDFPRTWRDSPDPRMDRNTDPQQWRQYWKSSLLEFMRVYYAMTASVDEQVGRVLRTLDELGIGDDTIVVFTSDHGEMFGAQGRIFKMTFYEESARVPLLMRWPGKIPPGLIADAAVSMPDVMPTLLGLMQQPIPRQVEGMDVSRVARGSNGPQPPFAFLQGMGHTYLWNDGFEWRALRDKRYTYARYLSDGKELLFDNLQDPIQAEDLAADPRHAAKLEEFRRKMRVKMLELNDRFMPGSWYRDHWTDNRVILQGARGEFHRELGQDVDIDVSYRSSAAARLPVDLERINKAYR